MCPPSPCSQAQHFDPTAFSSQTLIAVSCTSNPLSSPPPPRKRPVHQVPPHPCVVSWGFLCAAPPVHPQSLCVPRSHGLCAVAPTGACALCSVTPPDPPALQPPLCPTGPGDGTWFGLSLPFWGLAPCPLLSVTSTAVWRTLELRVSFKT